MLLIAKVFPIDRNPASSDIHLCLYRHMCRYINKSISSVSSELKKIHRKGTFGRCFAFDVMVVLLWVLQPFQMPRQKLDVSFHPWCWCCRSSPCPWQVDVTARGGGACAGANLPVVSSLSVLICLSLASRVQSQCAEPGLGLQSCWSLLWRCFCYGYTCVISFCDYKCVCRWNLFCPALQFLHFQIHLTGNFTHTV